MIQSDYLYRGHRWHLSTYHFIYKICGIDSISFICINTMFLLWLFYILYIQSGTILIKHLGKKITHNKLLCFHKERLCIFIVCVCMSACPGCGWLWFWHFKLGVFILSQILYSTILRGEIEMDGLICINSIFPQKLINNACDR